MAQIVGGIGTSHVPAIGGAIAKGKQSEPYWQPFFDGFPPVHRWLDRVKPDIVVIIYNDHGLEFLPRPDRRPSPWARPNEYQNDDEGWGLPVQRPFPGDPDFSWHLIESLVHDEFDITMCQRMQRRPRLSPCPCSCSGRARSEWPVKLVPVAINTVQHPLPSPARCFKFGQRHRQARSNPTTRT